MSNKKRYGVKKFGAIEFKPLGMRNMFWCLESHTDGSEKKMANYSVSILGHPAGHLCKACEKQWINIWESIIQYLD